MRPKDYTQGLKLVSLTPGGAYIIPELASTVVKLQGRKGSREPR
jgi:hypothetical protein